MKATYFFLICTIVVALLHKKRRLTCLCIMATNLVAWYQGVIDSIGIFFLCFFIVIGYIYLNFPLKKWITILLRTILYTFILAAAFHCIPGFFNIPVICSMTLSTLSAPFSMDLNFDHSIFMLMVYTMSDLYALEKRNNLSRRQFIKYTICPYIYAIPSIFIPGYLSGFILFDPYFPNIFWIWIIHNFFLVCMTEEVFFRGCLQRAIQNGLTRYGVHNGIWGITLTSFLFGMVHCKGGIIYMGLAAIAGFFYGYSFYKTGKIVCAMMVHFGLNLVHFLLFTYPMSIAR